MSKTRERVIKLAEIVDKVIDDALDPDKEGSGCRASVIEAWYEVFRQEREYLNVELNIEIDDLGDPVPGEDES